MALAKTHLFVNCSSHLSTVNNIHSLAFQCCSRAISTVNRHFAGRVGGTDLQLCVRPPLLCETQQRRYSTPPRDVTSSNSKIDPRIYEKPNAEDLKLTEMKIIYLAQNFFRRKSSRDFPEWKLYSPYIVFENYFKQPNQTIVGITRCHWAMYKYKFILQMRLAEPSLEILKITNDVQEGTIKVRWRILGVPNKTIFFTPWKLKLWNFVQSSKKEKEIWLDGFSIFHVDGLGNVKKHRMQRVMTDEEHEKVKEKANKLKKLTKLVPSTA